MTDAQENNKSDGFVKVPEIKGVDINELMLDATPLISAGGTLHHGRSQPLPLRVKSGSFSDTGFSADTAQETYDVPWEKVRLVCVGLVAERSVTDSAAYVTEKMVSDVGRMIKGGSADNGKIVSIVESNVLDAFIEDMSEPLRFDSSLLNYRSFLGRDMAFVSFQNFFKFVHKFVSHCRNSRFSPTVAKFLSWKRYEIQRYPSFYEYNEEATNNLAHLEVMLGYDDLDLSRTTWAQEWSE